MFLAASNEFLGINHFIFLGICLVLIISSLLLMKKFKVKLNTALTIMVVIAIISELIKITEYIVPYTNEVGAVVGVYLKKTGLPFHLCSIQVIFLIIAKVMKEGPSKDKLLAFIYPTGFLGALLALAMVTVTVEFDSILAWQYFIFHASLLTFGLYIPMSKEVNINTKSYLNTGLYVVILFIASIYLNGIISVPSQDVIINGEVVGVTEGIYTYFFYSTVPPLEGLPILNLENGWLAYILSIVLIGLIALTIVYIPFFIKDYKNYRLLKDNKKEGN